MLTRRTRLVGASASILLFSVLHVRAQTSWHVDDAGSNSNSGLSWSAPFGTIEHAFSVALPGDTVKVAEGVYAPGTQALDTFMVPDGVRLEGGYAGDDQFPDPDPALFDDTILDGLGSRNVVLTCIDTAAGTVVRGFTIKNAVQHAIVVQSQNAVTRPSFDQLTVQDNGRTDLSIADQGAGLHVTRTGQDQAFPNLQDCLFLNNTARGGGGIFIGEGCTLRAENCVFERNQALSPKLPNGPCTTGIGGGAVWNTSFVTNPIPEFRNCEFRSNQASPEHDGGEA